MEVNNESSIYQQAKAEAMRIFWAPEGSHMSYHDAVEAGVARVVATEEIGRRLLVEVLDEHLCPEIFFRSVPRCATWPEIIRYVCAQVLRNDLEEQLEDMVEESDRRIESGETLPSSRLIYSVKSSS